MKWVLYSNPGCAEKVIRVALIKVAVRNDRDVPMSSVEGKLFITLLAEFGTLIEVQEVDMFGADAVFSNLAPSSYQVLVRHPLVRPSETTVPVTIKDEQDAIAVYFRYTEETRTLFQVDVGRMVG